MPGQAMVSMVLGCLRQFAGNLTDITAQLDGSSGEPTLPAPAGGLQSRLLDGVHHVNS